MARYKVLKSVAHNFGHSFTSLLNYWNSDYVLGHLVRRARETRESTLVFDILSGVAEPHSLVTPPIAHSLAAYRKWFPQLVASHRTQMEFIRSSRMVITIDHLKERPNATFPECRESPCVCRVEIEDDRGKVWSAELVEWWFPSDRMPTPKAERSGLQRLIERLGQFFRSIWSRQASSEAVA